MAFSTAICLLSGNLPDPHANGKIFLFSNVFADASCWCNATPCWKTAKHSSDFETDSLCTIAIQSSQAQATHEQIPVGSLMALLFLKSWKSSTYLKVALRTRASWLGLSEMMFESFWRIFRRNSTVESIPENCLELKSRRRGRNHQPPARKSDKGAGRAD